MSYNLTYKLRVDAIIPNKHRRRKKADNQESRTKPHKTVWNERKTVVASRWMKLFTLGEEAVTFLILLKRNVVENDGMLSGSWRTPFWLCSRCSCKLPNYCPSWNFRSEKWKFTGKMNEQLWSFCQTHRSYTHMSVNVLTFNIMFIHSNSPFVLNLAANLSLQLKVFESSWHRSDLSLIV